MESQRVKALLELSGVHITDAVAQAVTAVRYAPDPETAIKDVMGVINVQSPLLQSKWRKHVMQMWFASHPNIPSSFVLPLKSGDVAYAHVLLEAQSILREIERMPICAQRTSWGYDIPHAEEDRLTKTLAIFRGDRTALRRMIMLLEELRLLRVHQRRLQIVRSRTQRFTSLPLSGQFYLLWHADMYHLEWCQFDPEYGVSLSMFQEYLPMVWEMLSRYHEGSYQRIDELTWQVVRAFRPLWQQQGRFAPSGTGSMIGLYEQSLLQRMIETHLVQKSLARYGLISYEDDVSFTWTAAGEALLHAERMGTLPCIAELLS